MDSDDQNQRRWAVPPFLESGAAWAWRFLLVAAAAYVLMWTIAQLRVVVLAATVGLMIAAGVEPVVSILQRRRVPRLVATWVGLLAVIGSLVALVLLLAPQFVDELDGLGDRLEEAVDDGKEWLVDGPLGLEQDRVDELEEQVGDSIRRGGEGLLADPVAGVSLVVEFATGAILAVVLAFFFVKDGPVMWDWLMQRTDAERRMVVDMAGRRSVGALRGWLRGVAITGLVDALAIGIVLVVLGVPLAFSLATLTFFGAFFPIVGATVAGALAAMVALVSNGFGDAVLVAAAVLVIQQVEGDLILPLVMSRTIALHPAVILIALTIGGLIAGVAGAFVAVPLSAALVAIGSVMRNPPVPAGSGEAEP